jgi:hypothetical protein
MVTNVILHDKNGEVIKEITVSDEDHEWLSPFNWYLKPTKTTIDVINAHKNKEPNTEFMHIMIVQRLYGHPPGDYVVEHKDLNTLNCLRENLRYVYFLKILENNITWNIIEVEIDQPVTRKWRYICECNK